MRLRPFVLLPFVTLACGPADPTRTITTIDPVAPLGTLAGLVTDAVTGAPIEGVAGVVLNAADKEATTDAGGAYRITEVPASTALAVRYHKDGFVDALDEVQIPSSAGNLAQN